MTAWLLLAVVSAAAWLVLGPSRASEPVAPTARLATALCAGPAALWLALWSLDALGVAWSRGVLLGLVGVLLGLGATTSFLRRRADLPSNDLRWTDLRWTILRWLPAAAALGVFVAVTAARLDVHPDFVFHWGVKGAKHFLAGGIDVDYLSRPWNRPIHPDYPGLVPGLFAAVATLEGRFDVGAVLAVSGPFFLLLLLAADLLLARLGTSGPARALGLTAIAWGVLAFAVGFRQAGGADLPLAAAATLGAAALAGSRTRAVDGPSLRARDVEVGCAALFLACTKIEGVVLGGLLVVLHGLRRARTTDPASDGLSVADGLSATRAFVGTCLRAGLAPLAVVVAWAAWTHHHGLFLDTNTGDFELARLAIVVPEMARAAGERSWHGLPWLLAALPLLARWRPARWPALLLGAQLAAYVAIYLSAPVDTRLYVATSAARLYLHLVPATLGLLVAALDHGSLGPRRSLASGR